MHFKRGGAVTPRILREITAPVAMFVSLWRGTKLGINVISPTSFSLNAVKKLVSVTLLNRLRGKPETTPIGVSL